MLVTSLYAMKDMEVQEVTEWHNLVQFSLKQWRPIVGHAGLSVRRFSFQPAGEVVG